MDNSCSYRRLGIGVVLTVLLASCPSAQHLSNVIPRRDSAGDIINAHDGQIVHENGTYYWFAAGYAACKEQPGLNGCAGCAGIPIEPACGCGFEHETAVNLYTSVDLVNWTSHGNVLQMDGRPANTSLFSPRAIFNQATGNWVLWYNYVPNYSYAVATSTDPRGPFITVDAAAGSTFKFGNPGLCNDYGQRNNSCNGDFSLFKDDDGVAYMLYSHDPGPAVSGGQGKLSVARLSKDYLSSSWDAHNHSGEQALSLSGFEAPAMFKRGSYYYALTSSACCYCGEGGTVYVHRASNPLGPYKTQKSPISFGDGTLRTQGQQTTVTTLPNGDLIWQGDRWQSAPDHLKAHDFQFWYPLDFTSDGMVKPMQWIDGFDLATTQAEFVV